MSFPIPFLLGLLVLFLHELFVDVLPGGTDVGQLLPYVILFAVPSALAIWSGYLVSRTILAGSVPPFPLRLQLTLQGLSVPLVFAIFVFPGGLPSLVIQSFPNSQVLQVIGQIAPLVLMEISLRYAERGTARWLDMANLGGLGSLGPERLPMVYFFAAPVFLFSLITDLAFESRKIEVFFTGTAAGSTVGLLLIAFGLCFALPVMFRYFMPTSQRLPSNVADSVRATASALGFAPSSVLCLHTNHRMINAMMIAPLPWPRYLLLTDGLMSLLDAASLRGVVAHEVGHARASHPGLLILVYCGIPILLLYPIMTLGLDKIDPTILSIACAVLLVFVLLGLRKMAHQFEFEADVLSADALGGADPCIAALKRVSSVFPQSTTKATFRHPSEEQRIQNLLAWERDEDFKNAFYRRCVRLRIGIATCLILAVGVSVWVHASLWPLDRVVYQLYTGDFSAADEQIRAIDVDSIPTFQAEGFEELWKEVEAAVEIGQGGGNWHEIRERIAEEAWIRGVNSMDKASAEAARPWLALALSSEHDHPIRTTLYLYCVASIDENEERTAQLKQHLIYLRAPIEVINALPGH